MYVDPRCLRAPYKRVAWILFEKEYKGGFSDHISLSWGDTNLIQRLDFWGVPFHCLNCHCIGHLLAHCPQRWGPKPMATWRPWNVFLQQSKGVFIDASSHGGSKTPTLDVISPNNAGIALPTSHYQSFHQSSNFLLESAPITILSFSVHSKESDLPSIDATLQWTAPHILTPRDCLSPLLATLPHLTLRDPLSSIHIMYVLTKTPPQNISLSRLLTRLPNWLPYRHTHPFTLPQTLDSDLEFLLQKKTLDL